MSDWHDMESAPRDGSWVRLKATVFGESYVSWHLWRWAGADWRSAHGVALAEYKAHPIAWAYRAPTEAE